MLVDLGDHAIGPVRRLCGSKQVVALAVRGGIGRGPQTVGQEIGNHRIHDTAVVGNRLINLGLSRYSGRNRKTDVLALSFISYEPEGPVFDQRTAQRTAELVVVESILGRA